MHSGANSRSPFHSLVRVYTRSRSHSGWDRNSAVHFKPAVTATDREAVHICGTGYIYIASDVAVTTASRMDATATAAATASCGCGGRVPAP